jgi:predicted DNA-binding protein YlxM (UPF0122 family)
MTPRYDSMRKCDPNKVRECIKQHPDWSLKEIAAQFGISPQRVDQIKKAKPKP